jgi:hypothetical protein
LADNPLHLSLAEELSSFAASDMPQPYGSSAMIVYAVPGFAWPYSPLHSFYRNIYIYSILYAMQSDNDGSSVAQRRKQYAVEGLRFPFV